MGITLGTALAIKNSVIRCEARGPIDGRYVGEINQYHETQEEGGHRESHFHTCLLTSETTYGTTKEAMEAMEKVVQQIRDLDLQKVFQAIRDPDLPGAE